MRTFAQLLTEYMARTGISDAELARSLGVRRQTIFRWKEGLVARPRHRDEVLGCAQRLRLAPEERDALLVAAGFPPEETPVLAVSPPPAQPVPGRLSLPAETAGPWPGRTLRRQAPVPRLTVLVALAAATAILAVAVWRGRAPAYPVAGQGETLLVVGRFVNYSGGQQGYNVAGRVRDALAGEVEAARLDGVRVAAWPEEIADEQAAADVARRSGAKIVIWGEYDSGRVIARLSGPGIDLESSRRRLEELLDSPTDLPATINSVLPAEVRALALMTLGQLYAEGEEWERARAVLDRALEDPPDEPDARASLYFRLGYVQQAGPPSDLEQAIESYSHALVLQPGFASAYNNRGVAYLHRTGSGDLDRAVEDLTQSIMLVPGAAIPYNNRGVAYLKRSGPGDLAAAVADFSRMIEQAPDAPEPHFNRGLAYIRQGNGAGWLADFERVLALDPDHTGVQNALCWAYALDGRPGVALPYCDRAVALDPTGLSRDSRGVVYAQLGRLDEAAADFQRFRSWLPQQPPSDYPRYGPRREVWLEALKAGRNPIGAQELEQLRREF